MKLISFIRRRVLLAVCAVRAVKVIFCVAQSSRRVGVANVFIDPLCDLAHDGVHPGDVSRYVVWTWLPIQLLAKKLGIRILTVSGVIDSNGDGEPGKFAAEGGAIGHADFLSNLAGAGKEVAA